MTEAQHNQGEGARRTVAKSDEKKREPSGVLIINFEKKSGVSLGEVFGKKSLTAAEMTARLWRYIRDSGLASRGKP